MHTSEGAVRVLLDAVATRDLQLIQDALSPHCTWQNVPNPPAVGRTAVLELLAPILCWADEIRWDIVSAGYDGDTAWVERADRFWIDGQEYTALCNGVITVDLESGTITSVRDYVDLGEWRARVAPVLATLAGRSPVEVVTRHLAAVGRRDPIAMAADYALDAVLTRAGDEHRGWFQIADYFRTVPERLGSSTLVCAAPTALPNDDVSVHWTITSVGATTLTGTDVYRVERGRIVRQSVGLHGPDF